MALPDSWERRLGIAEWEPQQMTICIAAICDSGHGIVMAADRELGIQITSGEMVGKFLPLFGNHSWKNECAVGIAGTATNATDVIGEARRLRSKEMMPVSSSYELRRIVEKSYRHVRLARAEGLYLASRGWTLEDFYDSGTKRLSESVFAQIDARIVTYDFNTDLIVAGFFEEEVGPSIITVVNPGVCVDHTILGFWCVGSGSTAAQVSLFNRSYSWSMSPEEAAFYLLEAKVAAEKATGVGGRTDMHLMRRHGVPVSLGHQTLGKMNKMREGLQPKDFTEKHIKSLREESEFAHFSKD